MPTMDKSADMSADVLQKRIQAKQAEVGGKLAALKTDLTRNPVAELAERKPLVILGAAVAVGFLGVLVVRGRGGRNWRNVQQQELIHAIVKQLEDKKKIENLSEEETHRIAQVVEKVSSASGLAPKRSHLVSFLEAFVGPIAKMVTKELFNSVMALVAAKLAATVDHE